MKKDSAHRSIAYKAINLPQGMERCRRSGWYRAVRTL